MANYEIYIVEFSSANYCGAPSHCAVMASSEDDAIEKATTWAEEYYYEEDGDQILEEMGEDFEGPFASMGEAVRLIGSDFETYYADPVQRSNFYPMIG